MSDLRSAKDRAALFGGKSADKDTPKTSSGPRKIGKLNTSFGKTETKTGAAGKKTVTKKTVTKKKKQVTDTGKAGEAKAEEVTTTTTTTVEKETGQPEKKTEETKVDKKEVVAEKKPEEKIVEKKEVKKVEKKVEEKKVEKKTEAATKKEVVKKTEEKKPETKKTVAEKKAGTDVTTKHDEKDYVKKDKAGRDVKVHEEVKAETTTTKEGGKQVTATKTTKVTKTVAQEKPAEVVGTKTVTKKTTKMETKTKDVKPGEKVKEETLTVKTSKPTPAGEDSDWDLSAELQANIDVVSDVELGPEGTIQMKKKVVKKEEPTKVVTKTTETKTVGEGGAVKTVVTTETKTTKPEVKTTVVKDKVVKKEEKKIQPKETVTVEKKTVVEKAKIETADVAEGGVFIVSAETDFEEGETVPAVTMETKVEVAEEEQPMFIIDTSTEIEETAAAEVQPEEEPVFIIETSTEIDEEEYKQEPVFEMKTEVAEEEAPVFIIEASTTVDETVTPIVTIDEKPAVEVKAAEKVVEPKKVEKKPEPKPAAVTVKAEEPKEVKPKVVEKKPEAKPVEPKKVEKKPEPKPAAVTVKAEEPKEVKPKVVEKKPEEKPVEPKKVEKKPEPKPAAVTVKAEEPKEVKPKVVEKKPQAKPVEPKKVEKKPEPKPAAVTVKAEEPKEVKPKVVEKKPEEKPVEPKKVEKKPEPKPAAVTVKAEEPKEVKPEVIVEKKPEAAVVTAKTEEVKEVKMQVKTAEETVKPEIAKAEKEADQEVCEIMQIAKEEPAPAEEKPKEETELIMKKTFTESIKPDREFIPIPEDFYNTIFYFSGMGSAIGSAVSRGVYVPFSTAKVGLEAETIEAEELKKKNLNETTRRVTVVRQAREQATDLSTDLRKLQLLLSGIPTFQDTERVPQLPSRPVDEPLHYKYLQTRDKPHVDQYTTRTQTTRRYEMPQAPSAAPFILAKPPSPTKPLVVVAQPNPFAASKPVMERVREEIERNRLEQEEREKQKALEKEKEEAALAATVEATVTATVEEPEPPKAPEPAWKAGAVQTCLVMPKAEPVEPAEVRSSPITAEKSAEVETEAPTDKIKPPPPPPPPLKKPEAEEISPKIDKKEDESKQGIDASYSSVAAAIAWEAEAEKQAPYRPPSPIPIAAPPSHPGQIPEPPSLDSIQGQTRVPVFKPVAFQSQHPKMQFGVGSAIHADTKPQFQTRPVVSHPPKTYDDRGQIRSVAPPTFSVRPVAPPPTYGDTGRVLSVAPASTYAVQQVSPPAAYGGSGKEIFREYKAERPVTGDEHDGVSMQGSVQSKGLKTWQLSRLRALEARGYEIKPDLEHETYDQLESKAHSMPDDIVATSSQHSAKGYQRVPAKTQPVKIEPQAHQPVRSCSFQPKGIGTPQQQEIALPYSDM